MGKWQRLLQFGRTLTSTNKPFDNGYPATEVLRIVFIYLIVKNKVNLGNRQIYNQNVGNSKTERC